MTHPEDQLAAARDLLADGATRREAVDALSSQFGISAATAYRRIEAVLAEVDGEAGVVLVAEEALAAMLGLLRSAVDRGDEESIFTRAEALAAMAAKLKLNRLVV